MSGVDSILGMTYEEATSYVENKNFSIRIINRDGEPYMVTQDNVLSRVNVKLIDDKVVGFYFG